MLEAVALVTKFLYFHTETLLTCRKTSKVGLQFILVIFAFFKIIFLDILPLSKIISAETLQEMRWERVGITFNIVLWCSVLL